MTAPVSVRIDKITLQKVSSIARRRKVSTSQVIREAVENEVEKDLSAKTPYERVAHLIGIVRSGDPHRSEDMGRKFTELLRKRRNRG